MSNADVPILCTLPKLISLSDTQFLNVYLGISVSLSDQTTFSTSSQSAKTFSPILVTVSGITTSVKLSQSAKALFPIVLTYSGKENYSIPVPANALSPIVCTPGNKVTFLRFSIPLQKPSGILGVPLNTISRVFRLLSMKL